MCGCSTCIHASSFFLLIFLVLPVVGVAVDLEERERDMLYLYAGLLQAGGGLVVAEDVLVGGQVLRLGDERDPVKEVGGGGQLLVVAVAAEEGLGGGVGPKAAGVAVQGLARFGAVPVW